MILYRIIFYSITMFFVVFNVMYSTGWPKSGLTATPMDELNLK